MVKVISGIKFNNNYSNLNENVKTIYDMVNHCTKIYKKRSYFRYIKDGKICDTTYKEVGHSCQSISLWLDNYRKRLNHQLHVAIIGKNTPQFGVTSISVVYSGAISIPLNPDMDESDLEYYLNYFEVDILVYDNDLESKVKAIQNKCPKIVCWMPLRKVNNPSDTTSTNESETTSTNESDTTSTNEGDPTYLEDLFTTKHPKVYFKSPAKPETCCFYILTSGTTGKKKGVMLSHNNILKALLGHCSNYGSHDYRIAMLPFSHCFGGVCELFFNMRFGVTNCMNTSFQQLFKEFLIYQPTSADVVPMVAKLIYKEINKLAMQYPDIPLKELKNRVVGDNLRLIVSSGAHLDSFYIKFFKKIDIELQQCYGMTECSTAITKPVLKNDYTINSVGIVNKFCQVRSKDGEIQIKGPIVMLGYYKIKEETDKVIDEDGWLSTGDMGYVDKYGYLYITGRKKNLIILSNGKNISPEAIENQFSMEELINEMVVFGHNDSLNAEIFPNFKNINDNNEYFKIKEKLQNIINYYNHSHPSYEKLAKFYIREKPFQRTASNKINRKDITFGAYFKELEESSREDGFTEIERKILDLIKSRVNEATPIEINTNFFDAGLNSLGGMLFIKDIKKEFGISLTVDTLFKYYNIKMLGDYISSQIVTNGLSTEVIHKKQKNYNLTPIQYAFIYFLNTNFTANLPNLFKIDNSIDVDLLSDSLNKLIDLNPELKVQIYKDDDGKYKAFRDDSLDPVVKFYDITDKEWDEEYSKNLLVEYQYEKNKLQYNIIIFNTETSKYLYFDVNHAIADGETIIQLLKELNEIYHGKELPPKTYTYYEYILDEKTEEGVRKNIELNTKYFSKLLGNYKGKRSVFTKANTESITRGVSSTFKNPLETINFDQVQQFCEKFGISENILFLTAFGFCVNLFSDESESLLTTVHNGRSTMERERLVGIVAIDYYFKFKKASKDDPILDLLKNSNLQALEAMSCKKSTANYCELFFQYQGDIVTAANICGKKGKKIEVPRNLKIDTYSFHLQIHKGEQQYLYELNYWENRIDLEIIQIFMSLYENIINGMIQEINNSVLSPESSLRNYIPSNLLSVPVIKTMNSHELYGLINNSENNLNNDNNNEKNIQAKLYVLSSDNNDVQPYGAWGNLCIECDKINTSDAKPITVNINDEKHYLYKTDKVYQMLPDGSLRSFENSGSTVMISKNSKIHFINLKKIENVLNNYKDINSSEVFITYVQNDQLGLKAIVSGNENINETDLNNYLKEQLKPDEIPIIDYIIN